MIGGDRSVNADGAFRSLNGPFDGSNLQHDQPNITHSPPNTDLRMDWADACSLGRLPSLNRYFLMILDKDTQCMGPLIPAKHETQGLQSNCSNNTSPLQVAPLATFALTTQEN